MNLKKLSILVGITILAGSAFAAGCSSSSSPAAKPAVAGEGAPAPGELPEETLVTYAAPGAAYSFQHPQSWKVQPGANGSVRFVGPDTFVSLAVVNNAGADAMAAATAAKAATAKEFAGYKEISLTPSPDVRGAALLTFEWDAGSSIVTGKAIRAHAERYYIPVAGGRMAVMTGSEPVASFDAQTIRDIALSVRVK